MHHKTIIEANGLGNSFVIVDAGKSSVDRLTPHELASYRDVLLRSGRDSLLIIGDLSSSVRRNLKQMRVLEKDGSESQMCGNGLRAVARYYFESAHLPSIEVKTRAGIVTAEQQRGNIVRTGIGRFTHHGIIEAGQELVHDTDVGEPHAIIFSARYQVEDLFARFATPIVHLGKLIGKSHTLNGQTRNLNVVSFDGENPRIIYNRTYERGVNRETLACGTGSACAAMTYGKYFLKRPVFSVVVKTLQGSLEVAGQHDQVSVTGEAQIEKILYGSTCPP